MSARVESFLRPKMCPLLTCCLPHDTGCAGSRGRLCNSLKYLGNLERAKGFEPSTPTLARLGSTPELRPRPRSGFIAHGPAKCNSSGMAATPQDLFRRLSELGIATSTTEHPPVFTVEEAKALRGQIPGCHIKNLFLKDKRDQLWLVVCPEDRSIELKTLPALIGSARLSFA